MRIFTKLKEDYCLTILLATHDLSLLKYCDRALYLKSGEIAGEYTLGQYKDLVRALTGKL